MPAILGLLGGGLLARTILWPIEMKLERRHFARLRDEVDALEQDLRS